jgi:hypothetical protein
MFKHPNMPIAGVRPVSVDLDNELKVVWEVSKLAYSLIQQLTCWK